MKLDGQGNPLKGDTCNVTSAGRNLVRAETSKFRVGRGENKQGIIYPQKEDGRASGWG